ncbi:MAG TPA: alpha-hydroxy acid oxidase [Hyphomicrobiales bacterium]|nr:alpha-hydroxy acid oxidase [Hyphomicrobiales bacterium]
MMQANVQDISRRSLLRFLCGSPLFCGMGMSRALAQALIEDPLQAVNVFDFEDVAKQKLSLGHYTYMAYGSDDSTMLRVNREAFEKVRLVPRRLVDVGTVDTSLALFGQRYDAPIFFAPVGAQNAFHPEGEVAVARAARARNTLQILSTVTNHSVEEVAQARQAPGWYQLYAPTDWNLARNMIERAESAGCTALALTVDIADRNMEESARLRRNQNPQCQACHAPEVSSQRPSRPMFEGPGAAGLGLNRLTWEYVDRLKESTSMKVLLKGIVSAEDAGRALEHGVDGIIVSNHGGRAEVSGIGSLESLQEVLPVVQGRVPVLVDSGFRRGTDVFKALALGATAVCIGRPYLWGLSAFGQEGVERVVDILTRELEIVMVQMGAGNLAQISTDSLRV